MLEVIKDCTIGYTMMFALGGFLGSIITGDYKQMIEELKQNKKESKKIKSRK